MRSFLTFLAAYVLSQFFRSFLAVIAPVIGWLPSVNNGNCAAPPVSEVTAAVADSELSAFCRNVILSARIEIVPGNHLLVVGFNTPIGYRIDDVTLTETTGADSQTLTIDHTADGSAPAGATDAYLLGALFLIGAVCWLFLGSWSSAINIILAAAAYNFRRLLAWLKALWRACLAMLFGYRAVGRLATQN